MTPHGVLVARSGVALAPQISVGHLLLQMVLALALVIGAVWALSKLAQRTRGGGRRARRAPVPGLRILSRQALGKNKSVAVVEVEGQRFLVGISGTGFTSLGELRPDDSSENDATSRTQEKAGVAAGATRARGVLDSLRDATVRH